MGSFRGEGDRLIAGRYRLGARLGRGGMGTVWRATDRVLGREVAVKELRVEEGVPEAEARSQRERTFLEARTVARLAHPGVIVVHDVVEQDERPWIVMELIDGRSLSDQLASEGPVPPREAARIGLELLGALRAAHAHGVLHRDLKPANVLMESSTGRVVLTDFGIAQFTGGTTITETGSFVGTPEYTAPERMSGGRTGPESDLWSLGALLCTAINGTSPFHRDSLGGVLHAVVSDDIHPPETARPLLPVVRGLLERDPDRRLDAEGAEVLLEEYLRTGRMPEMPRGYGSTQRLAEGAPVFLRWPSWLRRSPSSPARARTAVAALLLLASAVSAGVAAVAILLDSTDDARPPGGSTATRQPTAHPSPESPTASPTVTVTSTRTATRTPDPADNPVPRGYRRASDPAGFSLAVPDGFTRSVESPRIFYSDRDRVFRIGIHIRDTEPGGPLAVMRDAHAAGPKRYKGYRDARVTATTHGGHRAALWEFTWNGTAADGGPRQTFDLSWEEGGKMYDLWISAPVGERATARRHFDTAVETIRVGGPKS
ncbi:protein kinase [Streptomyces sp. NPDC048639]|uniref:serine/threonine-protein kinase n=1 Tax=Streptomyces sp. NPDC048639 TaxID=3365581 RepID=UPI003723A5EF